MLFTETKSGLVLVDTIFQTLLRTKCCHPSTFYGFKFDSSQVFALNAWQSELISAHRGEHPHVYENDNMYEGPDTIYGAEVGEPEFAPRTDSQDAWIFRAPLPLAVADASDFEMGRPRYADIERLQ